MVLTWHEILEQKKRRYPGGIPLDRIAVIILGGGQGERLFPLTVPRCKPAVTFGGRYRLIDVPISHSLNSGLSQIYVIGQYLASTLQRHVFHTYLSSGVSKGTIQLLVPEEREEGRVWYKGTADAIRQNLPYLETVEADYFLILAGDQLYNLYFPEMFDYAFHVNAGLVIGALPVGEKDARRMGLLQIDSHGRLTDFYEKPQTPELLERFYHQEAVLRCMGFEDIRDRNYLGSMGIYLFKKEVLFSLLQEDLREDFGKHLIPTQMAKGGVRAFLYDGYWEDIGTIESYYYANLAITQPESDPKQRLQCYDRHNLIHTCHHHLPAAKIAKTEIDHSLFCEGTIIQGSCIRNSIIGVRSYIESGTTVEESILLGNGLYGEEASTKLPSIGKGCTIRRAILDEDVSLGHGVQLLNKGEVRHYDSPHLYVRDGIIIVPKGVHLPEGFVF